ncbi:MAG: lactate dehydrogenase [Phyllobacteriaceae bacterium]|nr:lactate dehydrogenase [Phyllobacteriaceae bacterium]MBA89962.1 lactate dehydrogenase [Phyllobacteriaceae bacterium]
MKLSIAEAHALAEDVLVKLGYRKDEARIAAGHLMDCELRGLEYAGFARMLSIADRIDRTGHSGREITITKETPVSAAIDGADKLGYLVGQRATEVAIEKARASGISIVGANETWYTGMLSYYAEQATAQDLVIMIASNASAWVAPHGGTEGRFGTNPICFGFPSASDPVIWDIGTSSIIHAQVVLARRLGQTIPEGVAFDADGKPTTDPASALGGAFTAWGGPRGSGLAIVVQLFGMLAGSPMIPGELTSFGMVVMAMRPDLLTSLDDFKKEVAAYSDAIRSTRPVEGGGPVRMPFDRSRALREQRTKEGFIEVPDTIHEQIVRIAQRA